MGVTLTKSGKYNSEKMENKDTKKHSNMLCFNSRSDSIVPCETIQNINQPKKRFSLNRFKRRCRKSDEDSLENLREEFDRVNRIRYDLESNKPIQLEGNCEGLVCLHNGDVVIKKTSERNSLDGEEKSKSVDYIHERKKDDDCLSFLSVKSDIISANRSSFVQQESTLDEKCGKQQEEESEMDPTPPNSPQETTEDTTYGTVLGEQNIKALKTKIQKEIDRKTGTITEGDETDEENS